MCVYYSYDFVKTDIKNLIILRMKHCLKPVCQFVDDFDDVVVVLGAAPGQQEAVCLSGGVADHGDVFAGKRMESV